MLVVDLILAKVVQHSPLPFQFYAVPTLELSLRSVVCACAYAHDIHYLTCSKFNSLLTEMIIPQTYVTGFEKTLRVGSARDSRNARF